MLMPTLKFNPPPKNGTMTVPPPPTTPCKSERIARGPAPDHRIVVPRPEVHQPGVRIVQPAGKAERLKARIRIAGDGAPGVVAQLLHDGTRRGVDHFHRAAQRIAFGCTSTGERLRDRGPYQPIAEVWASQQLTS